MESILVLAGGVALVTEIIKRMPVAWTTNLGKVIAWVASAIVVGVIAVVQQADIELVIPVVTVVALSAHGLYDVAKGLIARCKK